MPPTQRRCNLFHSDGTPRKLKRGGEGCIRKRNCWYIHPDQPQWKNLPEVAPPPPGVLLTEDDGRNQADRGPPSSPSSLRTRSRERPRDGPRDRDPTRSPAKHDSKPRRSGDLQPPPPRRRSPSPSFSIASSITSSEKRGDAAAAAARTTAKSHNWAPLSRRMNPIGQSPGDSAAVGLASAPVASPHFQSSASLDGHKPIATGSSLPATPRTHSEHPNVPPSKAMPGTPSVPLPAPPAFSSSPSLKGAASAQSAVSDKPEQTLQERKDIWSERMKRLSHCLGTRADHAKLNGDLQRLRRLRQSWRFADMSESAQSALNAQVTEAELRSEQKKNDLSAALTDLSQPPLWPSLQRGSTDTAKCSELMQCVRGLRDGITEIDRVLKSYIELQKRGSSDEKMDVDGNLPPRKRQRASVDDDTSNDAHPPPPPSATTTVQNREMEFIRDKLVALERQISDLENMSIQQQRNYMDEVEWLMEMKLDEFDLRPGAMVVGQTPLPPDHAQKLAAKMQDSDKQITEITVDMEALTRQSKAQDEELYQLQEKVKNLEAQDAEHEKKLNHYAAQQEKNTREIQALTAALQAYMDRPLSPPHIVPPEFYCLAIEDPLLEVVREEVRALFLELRGEVQDMLVERNAEVYKAVWSKLALTLEMVEALARQIEVPGDAIHVS